ncbi:c-Myc-binding protein homolog [Glossina fuscipes]|uniref:c-Myc-binding protein homolog n=2 Tax=Nemorhina TaxID=44051 RepID=A0A9C6DL32_9MUSC|nr:c-Myc-binding protein homolog [Glossina fuscipes]XP_037891091.1 c-Myc-binding protein homolog [Glossina fuscipes]XP_037891092.1 c-Myc-binding protein homolog [Glossina fuscipes]
MAFKPIDSKRDEYRRYLERGGVIESLTKVFVNLLKERPDNPTEYLAQNLGVVRLQADNVAYLQNELEQAQNEIQRLTDIIRSIDPELLNENTNNAAFEVEVGLNGNNEHLDEEQDYEGASGPLPADRDDIEMKEVQESFTNVHINESSSAEATAVSSTNTAQ